MTLGYIEMLKDMGVEVGEERDWPIEWICFRPHPCHHEPGVALYRECLQRQESLSPVVLCSECYTVLDGWHRVAAYWREGRRHVRVVFADMHIANSKETCRVANVDWIKTLKPWTDLDCVSGSYHAVDWTKKSFRQLSTELGTFCKPAAVMRTWERTRSVCFLGNVARKKILDVGTRESLVPHWLAMYRADVTAFDRDISAVQQSDAVKIVQGDARQTGFESNTFDHILCTAVLKSIPDDGDIYAVEELVRVLKPWGLLSITVDFAQEYEELPSKATGARLYDKQALYDRLIDPSGCLLLGPVDYDRSDWEDWPIKSQSPKAFNMGCNVQVAHILLQKRGE